MLAATDVAVSLPSPLAGEGSDGGGAAHASEGISPHSLDDAAILSALAEILV